MEQMMPVTNTDAVLWYNVGVFGDAGYAVPNWSDDVGSLNPQILDFVEMAGRNLFTIMHHEDADLRIPPSINTLKRVHKLRMRCAQILTGRAVPSGEDNMEVTHSNPAGGVFLVFPVPYFKMRNIYMRRWGGLILMSICEAMQHTENRKEMEISINFAGQVGQYIERVYQNMAIEMFNKDRATVKDPKFVLTDDDFSKYNPSSFFTSTELVDTVPRLDRTFTEDRLQLLSEGIPVTELPELAPWPVNLTNYYAATRTDGTVVASTNPNAGTSSSTATQAAIMPAAPGP